MLSLPPGLLAFTLALLYSSANANPVGLYNQGPAILDRKPQVTVAPACRSTPAISVFGDIRLFASATSFCSGYIGITHTHMLTTTVPTFDNVAEPTHTADRQAEEDAMQSSIKEEMLSKAPGAASTREPAAVSQACSCLLPTPITIDATRTVTKYVRATVPPENARDRLRMAPIPEPVKAKLAAFDKGGLR